MRHTECAAVSSEAWAKLREWAILAGKGRLLLSGSVVLASLKAAVQAGNVFLPGQLEFLGPTMGLIAVLGDMGHGGDMCPIVSFLCGLKTNYKIKSRPEIA